MDGFFGEEDCAVSVGFKIDADIKPVSCCMKMFDSSRCAFDVEFEDFLDVFSGCTIGVSGLDNSDLNTLETCCANLFCNEEGCESCNTVTVEKGELTTVIDVIVDNSVGITVKGAAAFER